MADVVTVKRSEFVIFLNTGTAAAPVWSLIGDGVTSAKVSYNPQTSEEVYIHQDSGTTEVESYKPTLSLEMKCKKGDPAWDALDALRQARAILSAAQKEICMVYLYETPTAGAYPAERQSVSVKVDDFGGDGGTANILNVTLNFRGDAVQGTFDPTTKTFTAA